MTHYLWHHENWTNFRWDTAQLLAPLGDCRLLQGKLLSTVDSLGFSLENQAEILAEETVKTAAIEGEKLDGLITKLEKQMTQRTERQELFTIRWAVV